MIRESTIDRSINRLIQHFGKLLLARPPVSAAVLARLEESVGPLPRELIIFLATCDGLDLRLPGQAYATRFCTTQDMLTVLSRPEPPAPPPGLLPIRSDRCGRDWLVLDKPPMHGVVLRWDPGTHGEQLMASSFGAYFEAWSQYLVKHYAPDGALSSPAGAPPFDAAYVAGLDPGLEKLAAAVGVQSYFQGLELLAAGAEDFE